MNRFIRILFVMGLGLSVHQALGQPVFLFEPLGQSVSPGAPVLLQGIALGPGPVEYQWYKDDQPLSAQQDDFLFLPSASAADAGDYFVVATLLSLSTTSSVATISLDNTFTKITRGVLVDAPNVAVSAVWNDYDNDGFPDVFFARAGISPNELYHNNGDGTFSLQPSSGLGSELVNSQNAAWGDYDNDGWLDLLVVNSGDASSSIYRNNQDGSFTKASAELNMQIGNSSCAAWADYNRDGWLDLFIGTSFGMNFLYANQPGGAFTLVDGGDLTSAFTLTSSASWADADNDGDPDLLVGNSGFGGFFRGDESLFVNNGGSSFAALEGDPLVTSGGMTVSCAWIDFDNDLDLDVFLVNGPEENNSLFRNDGSNHFASVLAGDLTQGADEGGQRRGCSWGDYDNDGWVDVFVSNVQGDNLLYHNNGEGSFTLVTTGSPATDGGSSATAAWIDYDRDGFLDLHVANAGQADFLYRNNGNSNAWISIRCQGLIKNRFGVGAKVKVLANIGGTPLWQMREIASRDGLGSPSTLEAHFGLGDATRIDLVRVEWPNGLAQELSDVAINQFFVVGEPAIAVYPAELIEGDEGSRVLHVPVLLGQPTNGLVTVDFFTRPGSALADVDFLGATGTLVFQPGQTTNGVDVVILGDLLDEQDEFLFVVLTNATGSALSAVEARATILDDDPAVVAVNDIETVEGDSGTSDAVFTVFLSKPSAEIISATYRLSDFTGVAGVDYISQPPGVVVFQPGETSKPVVVQVIGDTVNEPTRGFGLRLLQATNATPIRRTALCNIIDNDPLPILRLKDALVWEGTTAALSIQITGEFSRNITLTYSTMANTAVEQADFVPATGQLSIPPGTTNQTFAVAIPNDSIAEPAETFLVHIKGVANAVIERDTALVRILDDDVQLRDLHQDGEAFGFSVLTMAGMRYRVEWIAQLDGSVDWAPLPGFEEVIGTGGLIQVLDQAASEPAQRFYRIVLLSE